jgi:chitodextrinase
VIQAISPGGAFPLITAGGIDVLHVNHHGSESSTNKNYMNLTQPAVAIVGVGAGETSGWDLPRIDVVEHVLGAQATACVTAPPAFVLQTEEGNPAGSLTSFAGFNVGDIKVTTDGVNGFTVSADGAVHQGVNELGLAGLPRTFALDDTTTPDITPPVTSITAPATGATVSGTTTVSADASDDRAVTRVEFYLDNVLQFTDAGAPYAWSWDTTAAANGGHMLTTKAFDAAGNAGSSAIVDVTVNNVADTTPPTAPGGLTATAAGKRKITLAWTASADNVGVTGYQVWRSSSATGTFTQIAATASTTYVNSGLTSGTTWYYQVKAYDAAGNVSAASNTANATAK